LWVEKTFIKKADLFKIIMKIKWKTAQRDSIVIANILREFNITHGEILDLMCGNGRIAINLARLGYKVTGVDISPKFIKEAQVLAKNYNVSSQTSFIIGDVRKLERILGNKIFDCVIFVWASLGYYDEKTDIYVLRNAKKFIKPRGLLIISDIILRENVSKNYVPFEYYSLDDFHIYAHSYVENGFQLVKKWIFFREISGIVRYIDELEMRIRLYSKEELRNLVEKAGWKFLAIKEVQGITNIIGSNI